MDILKVKLDISWTYYQIFLSYSDLRLGHIRHIRLKKSKTLENHKNMFYTKLLEVFEENAKKNTFWT